ncbi:MAG: CehA/McbA family metallohydrolase [Phycisphaeraceae bacterium]|nr:CehA/McbA family metallohydrolase [Phycisphaeraceae bacterium]
MPTLDHPYRDLTGGAWMRGNLHTHTTQSDGRCVPQQVIDDYARRGYGFLMISDHDILTDAAKYATWNTHGMVMIPGNEISANGPHLLHVDADCLIDPAPSRSHVINEINAVAAQSGRGFAIVNHPDWQEKFDHCSISELRLWAGYIGMEIYNGVITILDGNPYATNKWDMLLAGGRRVWGFANDDSHAPAHVELGWNTAYVKDRSVAGVVEALKQGRFYASTGVTITSITVDGMKVRIETENARRIAAIRDIGRRHAQVDDRVMEVEVPRDAKYVRFQCWGDGEKMAWTQPFVVRIEGRNEVGGSRYITQWQVTNLVESLKLTEASPKHFAGRQAQPWIPNKDNPVYADFIDVRSMIREQPGVVYLATTIRSEADRMGTLFFGYDGPVRIWLNDKEVFHGPGHNPAIADSLAFHTDFRKGDNQLLVALDSNFGKAWGIFCRVEW